MFDPDQYIAEKSTPTSGFDPDSYIKEKEGTPWSDVPKNAWEDIKGIGQSTLNMGKRMADPLGLGEAAYKQSLGPIKEATMEPLNQVKSMGKDLADLATHPIEHFKEHPVGTAMTVAPLVAPFLPKGAGVSTEGLANEGASEAAIPKPEAPEVTRTTPAPAPIDLGSEAADILKKAPPPTPESPTPETPPQSFGEKIASKIPSEISDPMKQVSDYLQKEYGEAAQKPGMSDIVANYLKEHSQNMTLKEAGAAPGQVRKMGVDRAHALADYMQDKGLVGPKVGTQGREAMVKQNLNDAGGKVGAFRKMASDRGAVQDPTNLINQVKSQLDQKYLTKGMYSGQKGSYLKALEELKKTDGTAEGISKKVTEMFKEAKDQNPLNKPSGPIADVARQVRNINHATISKYLTPEEMRMYENSLEDYGALTQINEFVKRRASTEAGGRLGPGAGISRAAVQKFLDSFGYRAEAKIASKLADYIRKNPDSLSRPKDIFRNYVDEAAEAVHEMGDAHQ